MILTTTTAASLPHPHGTEIDSMLDDKRSQRDDSDKQPQQLQHYCCCHQFLPKEKEEEEVVFDTFLRCSVFARVYSFLNAKEQGRLRLASKVFQGAFNHAVWLERFVPCAWSSLLPDDTPRPPPPPPLQEPITNSNPSSSSSSSGSFSRPVAGIAEEKDSPNTGTPAMMAVDDEDANDSVISVSDSRELLLDALRHQGRCSWAPLKIDNWIRSNAAGCLEGGEGSYGTGSGEFPIFRAIQFGGSLDHIVSVGDFFLNFSYALRTLHLHGLGNVESIGKSFLCHCASLEALDSLAELRNVKQLGNSFLEGCSSLRRVDLSGLNHVTVLHNSFLCGCASLESVEFEGLRNVERIGDGFLERCSSLQSLDLSPMSGVKVFGNSFLRGCSYLQQLNLSGLGCVETVGSAFLAGCSSLQYLELADGLSNVVEIGDYFLGGCTSLRTVQLNGLSNVTAIGTNFLLRSSALRSIHLGPFSKVTHVGHSFLRDCVSLETVECGTAGLGHIECIGDHFLSGCSSLRSSDELVGSLRTGRVREVGLGFLAGCLNVGSSDRMTRNWTAELLARKAPTQSASNTGSRHAGRRRQHAM